jgi:multidrug resistance efflux pump
VDDYDIAQCRVGSAVTIRSESYPDQSWRGVVEEVADVLTGRRIRPEDPGRPTDTRVLPVRVAFREAHPFKFGLRVEVEIDAGPKASVASVSEPMAGLELGRNQSR